MKYYAFLMMRPRDKAPWALIWEHRDLAEQEEFRVSPVVEVDLSFDPLELKEHREAHSPPQTGDS